MPIESARGRGYSVLVDSGASDPSISHVGGSLPPAGGTVGSRGLLAPLREPAKRFGIDRFGKYYARRPAIPISWCPLIVGDGDANELVPILDAAVDAEGESPRRTIIDHVTGFERSVLSVLVLSAAASLRGRVNDC